MTRNLFIILPGILLIGILFYLSWVPDPVMGHVAFFPRFLSEWADEHWVARTGVAMFPLGALAGIWIGIECPDFRKICLCAGGLIGIVVTMEFGQLLVPGRVFDWQDVFVGAGGGLVGIGFGLSMGRTWHEISSMIFRRKYRSSRITRIRQIK